MAALATSSETTSRALMLGNMARCLGTFAPSPRTQAISLELQVRRGLSSVLASRREQPQGPRCGSIPLLARLVDLPQRGQQAADLPAPHGEALAAKTFRQGRSPAKLSIKRGAP